MEYEYVMQRQNQWPQGGRTARRRVMLAKEYNTVHFIYDIVHHNHYIRSGKY